MITRIWHGATPATKSDEYLNLMRTIAIPDYRSTPGNKGAYAGVDCDPVINDRREQFPEQQRDGRWAASHSETESCACRPASQRGCGTSGQK
jgi:hypothetical protein